MGSKDFGGPPAPDYRQTRPGRVPNSGPSYNPGVAPPSTTLEVVLPIAAMVAVVTIMIAFAYFMLTMDAPPTETSIISNWK